jgi:hypothetical protein
MVVNLKLNYVAKIVQKQIFFLPILYMFSITEVDMKLWIPVTFVLRLPKK